MLAFPPVFALDNAEIPSGTMVSSELDGRWTCRVMTQAGRTGRVVAGVLELVQAGEYLVGRARCEGVADLAPSKDAVDARRVGLEGPLFGSVRGDRVVLWVTEVFGHAMWVLEGNVTSKGIAGTAVYADAAGDNPVRIEARFGMRRLPLAGRRIGT